ncbi:hypothetical protein D0U04_10515 [Bacillus clarus]|uniref:Putative transposase n=1 Tax=Bacillus clarus TaxID=2338372 RepID=A0A090YYD7_9BACI|nr:putative transposase [Bacillus clarus]RFT67184.1 hypothetical protein D0U04_10515 [Bacillus clarus]
MKLIQIEQEIIKLQNVFPKNFTVFYVSKPLVITVDKNSNYRIEEREKDANRQVKYLNNIVEQDYRFI